MGIYLSNTNYRGRKMKTSSAKNKGRRLQNEIVTLLKRYFGFDNNDVKSIPGSVNGEDVWLSKYARDKFPFSIEAKNSERLNIWKAILQATANRGENVQLVVFRKNFLSPYVTLDLETFLYIWKLCMKFVPAELLSSEALIIAEHEHED